MSRSSAAAWYERLSAEERLAVHQRNQLRKYGIAPATYDQLLEEQGGVCAICELTCTTGRRLAVDHCHTTGKVRGLLCANCNQAIGKLKDSPDLLRKAAIYLEGN